MLDIAPTELLLVAFVALVVNRSQRFAQGDADRRLLGW